MYRDICVYFRYIMVPPYFLEKYNIFFFVYNDGNVIFKSIKTYETIKMVLLKNMYQNEQIEIAADLLHNRLIVFNLDSIWQIDLIKL